jgi:hypothetical protein
MIVDFLKTPGHSAFEPDGQNKEVRSVSVPTPTQMPEAMSEAFKTVYDTLLEEGKASFYEGFYSAYPDEPRYYYSHDEYLEVDGGTEALRYIGGYELKTITVINGGPMQLIYINASTPNGHNLIIRTGANIENIAQYNTITEIPDLAGFSTLNNISLGHLSGYLLAGEEASFEVIPAYLMYYPGSAQFSLSYRDTLEAGAFAKLAGTGVFDEFLEGWETHINQAETVQ